MYFSSCKRLRGFKSNIFEILRKVVGEDVSAVKGLSGLYWVDNRGGSDINNEINCNIFSTSSSLNDWFIVYFKYFKRDVRFFIWQLCLQMICMQTKFVISAVRHCYDCPTFQTSNMILSLYKNIVLLICQWHCNVTIQSFLDDACCN